MKGRTLLGRKEIVALIDSFFTCAASVVDLMACEIPASSIK